MRLELSVDQCIQLRQFVGKRRGRVRLIDIGDTYVRAELLGAEGEVADYRLLWPITAEDTPDAKARRTRQINAEIQAERDSEGR